MSVLYIVTLPASASIASLDEVFLPHGELLSRGHYTREHNTALCLR